MNILVIGDLHFKSLMGYSDIVPDGRKAEKQSVLDAMVSLASDCEGVVFMGDNLNNRNNPSEVIKDFISFVERFKDKEVYVLRGN